MRTFLEAKRRITTPQKGERRESHIAQQTKSGSGALADLCRREGIAELVERVPRSRQAAACRRRSQTPAPGAERRLRRVGARTAFVQKSMIAMGGDEA